MMETMAAATRVFMRRLRQDAQLAAEQRQDERELADLGQGHGHRQADLERVAEQDHEPSATSGLPEQDDRQRRGHQPRRLQQVTPGRTACRPRRRTGRRRRPAWAAPRTPPARLNSERPTTIPARNAPSAIDTPNSVADPTAMPSASTRTVRVNSSRERVPATCSSSQGMTRPPTRRVKATRAAIFERRHAEGHRHAEAGPSAWAPIRAGSSTSTTTVNRSSTTSQPTAM